MLGRKTANQNKISRPDDEPGIECVYERNSETHQYIPTYTTETLKLVVTSQFSSLLKTLRAPKIALPTVDFPQPTITATQMNFDQTINPIVTQDYPQQPIYSLASSVLFPYLVGNLASQITTIPTNFNPAHFAAGTNPNTFYADIHGNLHNQPQTAAQAAAQTEFDGDTDSELGSINGDDVENNGPGL